MTDAPADTPVAAPPADDLAGRAARFWATAAAFAAAVPPGWPEPLGEYSARIARAAEEFHAAAVGPPPADRPLAAWCHDLRKPLTRADLAAQFLLRQQGAEFFGAFAPDLERVRADVQACVAAVAAAEAGAPAPPPAAPPAPAAPPPAARRAEAGSILLVEDDHDTQAGLAELLRADGHEVLALADGRQAVKVAGHVPFDLVLLDHGLPDMTGYDVLKTLRADRRMAAVPVLMVSGLNELERVVECIEAGADDFLTKPVRDVLLRAKVNAFLQKRRQHLRVLEQFFPAQIARELIDRPELTREARDAEVSVLFCDIRGFSRISERLGTTQTLAWVRAVMEELSDAVLGHQGVLVDLIGDELMAMWGAPTPQPDHAILACTAALDMAARLPGLNAAWAARLGEEMDVGIGINSGLARVGNTGTERKFKYGALGNTVNVASRIQGATKYLKTRLVVSQSTLDRLDRRFESRRLADVRVVNIKEPLRLHEVAPPGEAGWEVRKAGYEAALRHYEARELEAAARVLSGAISAHGAGGPELALMARTMEAMVYPDRWAKVADLPGK